MRIYEFAPIHAHLIEDAREKRKLWASVHPNANQEPCPHCLSEPCICDTETPSLFDLEDDGA